jgi:hypothetical protein
MRRRVAYATRQLAVDMRSARMLTQMVSNVQNSLMVGHHSTNQAVREFVRYAGSFDHPPWL